MSKKKKNGNGISVNSYDNVDVEKRPPTKNPIHIVIKSPNQKILLNSIKENIVTIVAGPAGSGKTMIAVVSGLREFIMGNYKKMIFTRPCVEANGENLGFLPGDLHEKIHPYMYPIFDFLSEFMTQQKIEYYVKSGEFLTLPLAFMRGVTFKNAFVILDEAQNTRPDQIRMFLTRIGEGCKIVITGDPNQSDIKGTNGLIDAIERLPNVPNLGIVRFEKEDIVRHPIVSHIESCYNDHK